MGPRCNGSSPSTRCRRARRAPRPGCSGPGYLPASCQPPGAKPPVGLGTIWVQLNARPGGRALHNMLAAHPNGPALELGASRGGGPRSCRPPPPQPRAAFDALSRCRPSTAGPPHRRLSEGTVSAASYPCPRLLTSNLQHTQDHAHRRRSRKQHMKEDAGQRQLLRFGGWEVGEVVGDRPRPILIGASK